MGFDELLTPSEYKLVMEDLQNLPSNLVEDGGQLFGEAPETSTDDSDNSEPKAKRKKPKRMCDSTIVNPPVEETQPPATADTLPCLAPYPGQYDFRVQLPADSSAHKWTYSKNLQKVFIDIDKVLALQFKWTVDDMKVQPEFFVRAMPVYTSHDSLKTPVTRCPIHRMPDNALNQGFPYIDHVMRCEHLSTSYICDPASRRYSCVTPLSPPQAGADTTTLTYKFVCKTSCLSGMNRKPISVIFTLEDASGQEFGRQSLAIKICSCPKRDKQKEENNELEKSQSSARFANKSVETPSMLTVRNSEGFPHPQAEVFRDIKHGGFSELNSSSSSVEASTSRIRLSHSSSSKILCKVKREAECDTLKIVREQLLGEFRAEFTKLGGYVSQLVANKETTTSRFWNYISSEADLLPSAIALEFQNNVYRLLNEKKVEAMRQNMMSYGPTPGPEPSTPCPSLNEWGYHH